MPGLALIAAAAAAANLLVGWHFGYRDATAYLLFWTLSALLLGAASRIVCAIPNRRAVVDRLVRVCVVAFALVVLSGFILGALGAAGPMGYLALGAIQFGLAMRLRPRTGGAVDAAPRIPVGAIAVLCAVVALVAAVGLRNGPLTLYDSLSYHLLFPARWLQEHRLFLIATPFSDEAQAYAPANGELFFLWLMAPFHGDLAARIGQLPFYIVSAATLYALCRRTGAEAAHAAYVPAFFLLSRPIVEQASGADVDLVCWAMFLVSIALGFAALDDDDARSWSLWGVAAGLYFGTKYVSLVYAPIVLAVPLLRGFRVRALWALPGLLLFGAPWYIRNWIVAGSPIYPSSVAIGGLTLAQGAFTRAAMNHSVFHTTDVRLLPVMVAHAFGTPLAVVWLPLWAAGAGLMAASRRDREAMCLLAAPLAMVALYWFAVPDNVDSRFLLPAAMLALIPLASLFRLDRRLHPALHVLLGAAVVWLVIGFHREIPARLPWFMGGWLALDGIVAPAGWLPFAAIAAAAAGVVAVARRTRFAIPLAVSLASLAAAILTLGAWPSCAGHGPCDLLTLSSIFVRPTMVEGWQWTAANVANATIAYSGNNLPYPLMGDRLVNRVRYVNIDRHRDWLFHDYDRARRRRGDDVVAEPLAAASGVLEPIPGPQRRHVDAVRPRYERQEGDRSAWLANLKSLGVDRLFVSTLSAYEIDYVAHNAGGFPVEDDWARGDPTAFSLLYDNAQVRIYAVHPP